MFVIVFSLQVSQQVQLCVANDKPHQECSLLKLEVSHLQILKRYVPFLWNTQGQIPSTCGRLYQTTGMMQALG